MGKKAKQIAQDLLSKCCRANAIVLAQSKRDNKRTKRSTRNLWAKVVNILNYE